MEAIFVCLLQMVKQTDFHLFSTMVGEMTNQVFNTFDNICWIESGHYQLFYTFLKIWVRDSILSFFLSFFTGHNFYMLEVSRVTYQFMPQSHLPFYVNFGHIGACFSQLVSVNTHSLSDFVWSHGFKCQHYTKYYKIYIPNKTSLCIWMLTYPLHLRLSNSSKTLI